MANNRKPAGISGGVVAAVGIRQPEGTPVYELLKQYEAKHANEKPKPTLLAELKQTLIEKGFTAESMRCIFPEEKTVAPRPNHLFSPIRGVFSASMRFDKGKSLGWVDLKNNHQGFPAAIGNVIGLIEEKPSQKSIGEFVTYREELDIIHETANFLLKESGANLTRFIKYIAAYATDAESLLIDNPISRRVFKNELIGLNKGLGERLQLADQAIKEKITLVNECERKLNEVKTMVNASVPPISKIEKMQNVGDLFLLRQKVEILEKELDQFKVERVALRYKEPLVRYTVKRVSVICEQQNNFFTEQENLLRDLISTAKKTIQTTLDNTVIDIHSLIGDQKKPTAALVAEQNIPLPEYKKMLDKAIKQQEEMLESLSNQKLQNASEAKVEINLHNERIKKLVNIQADKVLNPVIVDMSIGEIATRLGMKQQADKLANCTDPDKIKKLADVCKELLTGNDMHQQMRAALKSRLKTLAFEINAIKTVHANIEEQKAKMLAVQTDLNNLVKRKQDAEALIAAIPKAVAPPLVKSDAPKANLLATADAKQALGAAMEAIELAQQGVNKFKTEKELRGSAGGKVEAAGHLLEGLARLRVSIDRFQEGIYSKDEVAALRKQITILKDNFDSGHKEAGKSDFKFSNVFSKGTMNRDRVDVLLDALDKNLEKLESKLDKVKVDACAKRRMAAEVPGQIEPPSTRARR